MKKLLKQGIAFVGIGIALILYSFMELAFNFVVDKEQHFKFKKKFLQFPN